jgi:HEPN domain-containing protein
MAESVFHCQQAAEKAMKGFLALHDQPFPRTHELEKITPLCCEIDPSLERLLKEANTLSIYAVRFRYPGGPADPQGEETERCLALATRVFDEIQHRLTPPLDESAPPRQS